MHAAGRAGDGRFLPRTRLGHSVFRVVHGGTPLPVRTTTTRRRRKEDGDGETSVHRAPGTRIPAGPPSAVAGRRSHAHRRGDAGHRPGERPGRRRRRPWGSSPVVVY